MNGSCIQSIRHRTLQNSQLIKVYIIFKYKYIHLHSYTHIPSILLQQVRDEMIRCS